MEFGISRNKKSQELKKLWIGLFRYKVILKYINVSFVVSRRGSSDLQKPQAIEYHVVLLIYLSLWLCCLAPVMGLLLNKWSFLVLVCVLV